MPAPRDIPESIKREVRQRCGFGCVFCGQPLIEYDHMLGWAETKRHAAEEITLLCVTHHAQKSRGMLAPERVIDANSFPYNKMQCASTPWASWMFGSSSLGTVTMGSNTFQDPELVIPLKIDGTNMVRFHRSQDGRWLLDLNLYDRQNRPALVAKDNEVQFLMSNWDVEFKGARLIVREDSREILLKMCVDRDTIIVERANIYMNGVEASVRGEVFSVNGGRHRASNCRYKCKVGYAIGHREFDHREGGAAFTFMPDRYDRPGGSSANTSATGRTKAATEFGILLSDLDASEVDEARRFFEQLAKSGSHQAMQILAILLTELVDPPEFEAGRGWYEKAAGAGNANAMNSLGMLLMNQEPPQSTEALKWFQKAAAAGHPRAGQNLELALHARLG